MKINLGSFIRFALKSTMGLWDQVNEKTQKPWSENHHYNLEINKEYLVKGERVLLKDIRVYPSCEVKKRAFKLWIVPQVTVECIIYRQVGTNGWDCVSGIPLDTFVANMQESYMYQNEFNDRLNALEAKKTV